MSGWLVFLLVGFALMLVSRQTLLALSKKCVTSISWYNSILWSRSGGVTRRIASVPLTRFLVGSASAAVLLFLLAPARAEAIQGGQQYANAYGFDRCGQLSNLPSVSSMQTWWNASPYWWYNVYLGGANATCPAGTAGTWLNEVNSQGWDFVYTWVGPQPSCSSGYNSYFSSDPTVAFSQGVNEANLAVAQIAADAINYGAGLSVEYDLETAGNGTCQNAVDSFIQGWVNQMYANGITPGVYGSVCAANLQALASLSPPPWFIWGADWNGNPNTTDLLAGGCGVQNGDWVDNQRIKQYEANIMLQFGGISRNGDMDCADYATSPGGVNMGQCG